MNKQKLFLDFDGTIVNSAKAYCDAYNYLYKSHPNFKPANWWENNTWNLSDVAPLAKNCNEIFSSEIFFDYVDFINDNTKEIIEELSKYYEIVIASIGTPENIAYKSLWLKTNLPIIKEYIFLCNEHCTMNKEIIDMEGAVFIDDVVSNLESSNADVKIVFGDEYEWNSGNKYLRCINWTDVYRILMQLN